MSGSKRASRPAVADPPRRPCALGRSARRSGLPSDEPNASRAETLALVAVVLAGATGIVNVVTLVSDDLVDLFEMARRLAGT